eukprot:scaffold11574_cov132-Skeletonema_dohrnii-CCMP3373.AAC.5
MAGFRSSLHLAARRRSRVRRSETDGKKCAPPGHNAGRGLKKTVRSNSTIIRCPFLKASYSNYIPAHTFLSAGLHSVIV